jgi:hypothetical protein
MKAQLVVACLFASTGVARADLRSFTHTYEYSTVPEGRTAVELWHSQTRATSESTSPQLYQGILELEHGLTDHWDMAFYTVLEQIAAGPMSSESLHLAEAKLETRYRLADRGEWPVDTMLYLELAKEFGESLYEVEGKVIGARDFDDLTVAANAIVEIKVGKDAMETEPEVGWAVGATYQAHPKVRVGAESWGMVEEGEVYASVGPAVSLSPSSNFWTAITVGFGLAEADGINQGFFSARAIMGIEL